MMKKIFGVICLLGVLCIGASAYVSDEDPLQDVRKSLKEQAVIIETDDDSSSESLKRISGQYDLGYSLPEQSYQSSSHYRPGPFGREDSKDKFSQNY